MENGIFEIRGNYIQRKVSDIFIFYKPNFDYKQIYGKKDQLIFIEKEENVQSAKNYIPCMFYRNINSQNFLICFHGNSEDIFITDNYGLDFRSYLNMNVLFVEYPGYSLYLDPKPESVKIFSDAIVVYDWVKKKFHLSDDQIFVFGRSLGTSPAIYLASQKKPKALFLVSAFTSIKDVGVDKYVSAFLEDIFNSIKYIKNVQCDTLLIHGEKDPLISYQQSEKLLNELNKNRKDLGYLVKRPNMTHNEYDIKNDIIVQIDNFLKQRHLISNENINSNFDKNELIKSYQIPILIQRIIESKTFNINDFFISNKKIIKSKNAFIIIRLIDERIALSNGLNITIYNDRCYKEDYTINLYNEMNEIGKINFLYQLKNGNLICSTTSGDLFSFEIDEGDAERKKLISINNIIHKIEVSNSNEILLLSENFFKIYDDKLNEINSIEHKNEFINFLQLDDLFAFVTNDYYLKFYNLEKNKMKFTHNIKLKGRVNTYTIAKGSNKSLIIGIGNIIEYIDLEQDEVYEQNNKCILKENIIYIHKIHDQLFLASSDKGSIIQITINEKNQIEIIQKNFLNVPIKCLLYKNIKNILFTSEDKLYILNSNIQNNSQKDCKIF